jgi:hypothetical protein
MTYEATKKCNHCKTELPLSLFKRTTSRQHEDGFWPTCVICKREFNRAWKKRNPEKVAEATARQRAANPERFREATRRHRAKLTPEERSERNRRWDLKRLHGLTVYQYNSLLLSQSGGCAICGIQHSTGRRRLAVDHDHKTGLNRGLLCTRCNQSLERIEGDSGWGDKACSYLAKYLIDHLEKDVFPKMQSGGGSE